MLPILEVQNISKKFKIYHNKQPYLSLRDTIVDAIKHPSKVFQTETEEFWALKNVSFTVNEGESIGIIGKNGAGKSTLLKILSRITPPTKGKITLRGRVASLLEVGTGFHPELTGRENVYFNGAILGMKRSEIKRKFDEIVSFAGVEKFIDTPLKHYSSGMQLRLAFAVAAFLEAEILVVDEVLAVGDAEFQKKCLGKMEDVTKKEGRTVLFVSHNMDIINSLCQKSIFLKEGCIYMMDVTRKVVAEYLKTNSTSSLMCWKREKLTSKNDICVIKTVNLQLERCSPNHSITLEIEIKSIQYHQNAFVAIDVQNSLGIPIFQSIPTDEKFIPYSPNGYSFVVKIDLPPLIPDFYYVSVWIGTDYAYTLDWQKNIVSFNILDSPMPNRTVPHYHYNGSLFWYSYLCNSKIKSSISNEK
jgi:lipopolysaccharide transport system ATP-binding protein